MGSAVAVGPISTVATGVGLGVRVFITLGAIVETTKLLSSDAPSDVGDDEGSSVVSISEHAAINTETTRPRKTKNNGRSELIGTVYVKAKSVAGDPRLPVLLDDPEKPLKPAQPHLRLVRNPAQFRGFLHHFLG